mgnify:CR=1 FL=1
MIGTIARYSLREALQNRLLALLLALLLAAFLLAEFLGSVALTEHAAIRAAFAAALLRLGAVLVMALFVVTSVLRAEQERTLELTLALQHPRSHYVLGKLAAFGVIAAVLAAASGALVLLYAQSPAASLRWGVSLACELWLVAALGLLLAFSLRQPVVALAALGAVYLLARSLDALLLIVEQPVLVRDGAGSLLVDAFLAGLAWLLPSLHRFTDAGWVAHGLGGWADVALVLAQTAVYLPLLAAAAAVDLYRREF